MSRPRPCRPSRPRTGNAAVVIILVLGIVIAMTVAVFLGVRGAAIETTAQNASTSGAQRDSLLEPVATWAATGIVTWTGAHDGELPDDQQGAQVIADLTNPPIIEQESGYKASPVYRRLGKDLFEIVVTTADLGGSAHLSYPFTAEGRLLASVPDNVFLQSTQEERAPLEATPGDGTTPR